MFKKKKNKIVKFKKDRDKYGLKKKKKKKRDIGTKCSQRFEKFTLFRLFKE